MRYLILWIIAVSITAVYVTAKDKCAARKGTWRVAERTLFAVAVLGGSGAMFLTMQIVRHKTKKAKFMVGLPLIILLQTVFFFSFLR